MESEPVREDRELFEEILDTVRELNAKKQQKDQKEVEYRKQRDTYYEPIADYFNLYLPLHLIKNFSQTELSEKLRESFRESLERHIKERKKETEKTKKKIMIIAKNQKNRKSSSKITFSKFKNISF